MAALSALILCSASAPAGPNCPPRYDVQVVYGPYCPDFEEYASLSAWAMNSSADVVGFYSLCLGDSEAFLWTGGPSVTTLPRPPGVYQARAYGVNDDIDICGTLESNAIGRNAFFYEFKTNTMLALGYPAGATFSEAAGIGPGAVVVGFWGNNVTGNPAFNAFRWQNGTMTTLDLPMGPNHQALAINSKGQITGWMGEAPNVSGAHAYRWDNGKVLDIGVPEGFVLTAAYAISESGDVGGLARLPNEPNGIAHIHAFRWSNGVTQDLGVLSGYHSSRVFGLNDDTAVGICDSYPVGGTTAFVWRDGVMWPINDLIDPNVGWDVYYARAINGKGQITAWGFNPDSYEFVLLLLTPLPVRIGDANCDGSVNVDDLLGVINSWGLCQDGGGCDADLDRNEVVDSLDLAIVLANWD